MDTVLITFGAGRTGWLKASNRLAKEAKATGLFSSVHCLGADWLQSWDPEIYEIGQTFRRNGKYRGFGYWTWKPALLSWADLLFPNSQILYMDAGSHIDSSPEQIRAFKEILDESRINGALAWHLPSHSDEAWTKRELIELLNPLQLNTDSAQVQSGFIALPPSRMRQRFAREWRSLSIKRNGFYFSDELSIQQSNIFVEHRHDQSALSLLWKEHGFYSRDDLTHPSNLRSFPIIAARNNTSISTYQPQKLRIQAYTDLLIDKILKRR